MGLWAASQLPDVAGSSYKARRCVEGIASTLPDSSCFHGVGRRICSRQNAIVRHRHSKGRTRVPIPTASPNAGRR